MNPLKQKFRTRILSLGSWITFPCEASLEIMARAGFEWLVLDMEHAPLAVEDAARLIRVSDLAGIPAICRLPSKDPNLAKTLLDAGAAGIIVPMIESSEEAERAVASAYYPPKGRRGVGLGRAHAYGSRFEEYRRQITDDGLIVIAMIETAAGVENAEAIAATEGIDGILIGPYDLSGSLGPIGQLSHPLVKAAKGRVLETARRFKIGVGLHVVHPSNEAITSALNDGYSFLALGVDMILLDEIARKTIEQARNR